MKLYSACLAFLFLLSACDRPECKNTNPVFDKYGPDDPEYKAELARQMQRAGPENLKYWFNGYDKRGDKEYILTYVQGAEVCAHALVLVRDWHGIEALRRSEPTGYIGAELSGMRINADSAAGELVFAGLDAVID